MQDVSQREAIAGIFLGVMLAIAVTIWAYFLQGNLAVAIAVGISLFAISVLASVSGSALPFFVSWPWSRSSLDVSAIYHHSSRCCGCLHLPKCGATDFAVVEVQQAQI